MNVDYIVVGIGLAGISFCEQLRAHRKSFVVFDDGSQRSSLVAGGLYNPVVLKRFTAVWKSEAQLKLVKDQYEVLERRLGIKLISQVPVYRKFVSVEEQNNWFTASDKPELSKYLSTTLIKNNNKSVQAPFGFGRVNHTGRIAVKTLVEAYKKELIQDGLFIADAFQYDTLQISDKQVAYGHIRATQVVFTEGYGMGKNPFFKSLPLLPTKGELLTIHAPELQIDFVLKGPVFLIPIHRDQYLVGATYDWGDTSNAITENAKLELIDKLETLINCPFKIVDQVAGIRPTVKDRRPLVGRHNHYRNLYVLNGLGTRGVMTGPYAAKQLFDFIAYDIPLEKEIDIQRFAEG
ncbi:NAD(P)/FAD-dependent oxidoreductase [Aestuariivivens sediminis]|uniref:NAD(P)/FAD-dependent oxidoreductase n=1 Tax=Aestuariivivens sediminis TaxID=2913557 RepID=UPI001F5AC1F2|nr:FAD-dependent oxidoreductase [Aestuariivivens sediminis]